MSDRDENFRAHILALFKDARTKETALLAEYAMIKARISTPLELPTDEPRVVEICHRLKSLAMATHPEIQRMAEGGALPPDPEHP